MPDTAPQYELTDHDLEVDQWRRSLRESLVAAERAVLGARNAVQNLVRVFDVEIVDGSQFDIEAALTQARNAIAAAEHLTRAAQPFTQETP